VMRQPMKIPMRLDGEYEHKNPTSEYVKSVPQVVDGSEIVLQTKGGSEGPVEQRLKIVDDKLIHTMSMLDKDITAVRTYARKIMNFDDDNVMTHGALLEIRHHEEQEKTNIIFGAVCFILLVVLACRLGRKQKSYSPLPDVDIQKIIV